MDAKRRRTGDVDIGDARLRSRQQYLEKRTLEQLALLRRQVGEEAEEESRLGDRLSKTEKAEFARNRETLRLAEARNAIDEHLDGYILPDADYTNKSEALTRKHKEKNDYKSDVQLWESEVDRRVSSQIKRPKRVQQDDYEYVFDESAHIKFKAQGQTAQLDPEQQRLLSMLDEAEKKAQTLEETRKNLPIYKYKDEIIDAIKNHQILIVTADTGSGKSTQLSQYCRDAGYAAGGKRIACTQPRRVAAMSVAQRVAQESATRLGKTIGFSVRFESMLSEETEIEYMTEGILIQHLKGDPSLDEYSVVILDEVHERSVNTDILMAICKNIVAYRPEFRLILASASLDNQKFSKYFSDAPLFAVPGRMFPVQKHFTTSPEANYLNAAVSCIFQIHIGMGTAQGGGDIEPGDILVFLAGQEEIEAAAQYCEDTMKKLGNRVAPLLITQIYGALPADQQQLIFQPAPFRTRKVILATNIAETSLTIDGVRFVVDAGVQKLASHDAVSGIDSLAVVPISRASAEQRAGRAGRTGPGKCFRLWTAWNHLNDLFESESPELTRTNLDSITLSLKAMGINDILNFDFMDPPSTTSLAKSLENLYSYGYLDSTGAITKLGRRASELPLDPRLARALLSADQFGCTSEVITIVAMVSEAGSLFFAPKDNKVAAEHAKARFFVDKEGGDFIGFLRVFLEYEENEYSPLWCRENFIQARSLNRVRDVREQLEKLCDKIEIAHSSCGISDHISILKAITAGFFSNVARLSPDGQSFRVVKNGMTVKIHPSSSLRNNPPKWLIFYELIVTSAEYCRSNAPIDPAWLLEAAPHIYKQADLEKMGMDKKVGKGPGKVGIDR